jgi:hypothetical protein
MKTKNNLTNGSCTARSFTRLAIQRMMYSALIPVAIGIAGIAAPAQAQDTYTQPSGSLAQL